MRSYWGLPGGTGWGIQGAMGDIKVLWGYQEAKWFREVMELVLVCRGISRRYQNQEIVNNRRFHLVVLF